MSLQSHLYRRGASYVRRRRWPAPQDGRILQTSLRTNEPLIARRLAAIVTVESNGIFYSMESQGLSQAGARPFLEHIIRREQEKIAILRADARHNADALSNKSHDWAMGTALELLAQQGPGAAPLTVNEALTLRREGRSPREIKLMSENLNRHSDLPRANPNAGQGAVIKEQMTAALDRENFTDAAPKFYPTRARLRSLDLPMWAV